METMNHEDLNALIVREAANAWEKEEPLLLSELGQMKDGEVANTAKLLEGRLSHYISKHLSDEVLLIQHSKIPPIIGVVLRNDKTEEIENFDSILEKKQATLHTSTSLPRLQPSFWAAFRKLLGPDLRRYIILDDQVRFLNLAPTAEPPTSATEIDRSYIATSDEERDSEIYSKIERWCSDHELKIQDFQRSADTIPRNSRKKSDSALGSTLDRILDTLGDAELRKMVIPMDIVKKLSKS